MSRILVIDDDVAVNRSLERMLSRAGHAVRTAPSGEEGYRLALEGAFDVILSDLQMPGMSGLDVLRRLRDRHVDAALIIMTGYGTIETAVEAMRLGAEDYVQKPFLRDELLLRVKAAIERRQLARQVRLLQRHIRPADSLAGLVGESAPIVALRGLVQRAAGAGGTVLITGETGTGKELVARAIHAESARAAGPFVPVNCAALTETLLENELFGHARGAFTGATGTREGLIEHASGGTLFLDEIGTMSKSVQARLLRVVEAGEIRRLGENRSRAVDVRFVAATNADLQAAVAAGEFREDLFYRLNVLHVHLPPLRERGEDIRVLARHFLDRYGLEPGVADLSAEAWDVLSAYSFPGNVRQLEHVIQRAVAVAQGATVDVADLPDEIVIAGRVAAAPPPDGGVAAARFRAERDMIAAAIQRRAGDLAATARDLQVSRTTLWRLIRKHGLTFQT